MNVLLPLSDEVVAQIAEQVKLRGQGDRVGTYNGKTTVDLSGVTVVAYPERMEKPRQEVPLTK